jgi:hypothetical protein
MKCTRIGKKGCNCSCFEIDQEMDTILLIIGIVYGVCWIVIKSIQQCTYLLFSVNLLLVRTKNHASLQLISDKNTNYSFFGRYQHLVENYSVNGYCIQITKDGIGNFLVQSSLLHHYYYVIRWPCILSEI